MIFGKDKDLVRDLYIPDTHTPYHHKRAVESLIIGQVIPGLRKSRVPWGALRIGGDWFDNYCISRFLKHPSRINSLKKEHAIGFKVLEAMVAAADWKELIFLMGNHEFRLETVLKEKMPELYETVIKAQDGMFNRLKSMGFKVIPYMQDTQAGLINFTHDIGLSGKRAVEQTLHEYQDNVVMNHVHRFDLMVRANAKGVPHVGACFGWLGDYKKIDYKHRARARREWVLGFGVGYRYVRRGWTWLVPVPIIKNTAVVEGRLFKG